VVSGVLPMFFPHSQCCGASSIEAASIHGWPNHPVPERHIAIAGKLNGSNRNPIGIQDAPILR